MAKVPSSFDRSVRRAQRCINENPLFNKNHPLHRCYLLRKTRKPSAFLKQREVVLNKVLSLLTDQGTVDVFDTEVTTDCYQERVVEGEMFGLCARLLSQVDGTRPFCTVGDVMEGFHFSLSSKDEESDPRVLYLPLVLSLRRPFIELHEYPIPSKELPVAEVGRRLRSLRDCVF